MILPFMQRWKEGKNKGKRTYFVEKIISSLLPDNNESEILTRYLFDFKKIRHISYIDFFNCVSEVNPKPHTIRRGNRWKKGNKIHFAINNRSKDYFQFAPIMECTGVQDITFNWVIEEKSKQVIIEIDGEMYGWAAILNDELTYFTPKLAKLAVNDGFDTLRDFFDYFNEDFEGQIIHWTEKRY